MLLVVAIVRVYRRARRTADAIEFDAPAEAAPATLNLSQAIG
jgi:hypothetical protein